jgi:ligand-binding sensor domain-containing protein
MRIFLVFFLFCSIALSQNSSIISNEWKSYTDVKDIYSFVFENNKIWAASNGGAFVLDKETNEHTIMTNVTGLNSVNLRSVCIDAKGRVWFGNSNGYIDIYDKTNDTWQHLPDIYLSTVSSKKSINQLYVRGDSVFIATEFGLSVYDTKKNDFQDSYFKFGNFSAFLSVSLLKIIGNNIYVVTSSGMAVGNLKNPNLLSPDSWKTYTVTKANSSSLDEITAIESFNDKVYIGTKTDLIRFENDVFYHLGNVWSGLNLKLFRTDDYLYIFTQYWAFQMDKSEIATKIFDHDDYVTDFKIDGNGLVWYSIQGSGLKYYDLNKKSFKTISLNCPNSNLFSSVAVDANSRLWAASAMNGNGRGFYTMKDDKWTNFYFAKDTVLGSNDYYKILIDKSNAVWIGSWGSGIAVIKNDSNLKVYNEKNSALCGIGENPNFVTINDMATDYDGNIWILNSLASNGKALVCFYPKDSSWNSFSNGLYPGENKYQDIVVDDIGTKWFISGNIGNQSSYPGVFYYNNNYSLSGASNGWGLIENDIISSGSTLTCLALDRTNELWIGSSSGLALIYDPRDPSQKPTRPCYQYSNCNMSGQYINCIAVDALNYKWVGTQSSGIWVLSSDGTSIIAQINTTNSKILSNDVKSIAIDNKTGMAYIGTSNGLSVLKTILIEPVTQFGKKLKVSPNPFIPGEGNAMIDGLVEGAQLKVITSAGKIVKDFVSPGGRIAFWDGTDNNNHYVASGVYFIIAYSQDGSEVSKGKVAVIKKH